LPDTAYIKKGKELLIAKADIINELEIVAEGFENTKRKTVILKIQQSYDIFKRMVVYYGMNQLITFIHQQQLKKVEDLFTALPPVTKRNLWTNVGGQLITIKDVDSLRKKVRDNKIKSWDDLHAEYTVLGNQYPQQKLQHALASLAEITGITIKKITAAQLDDLLQQTVDTKQWITDGIYTSRAKDYSNPYRKMVYDTQEEMDKVVGKLDDNSFIQQQREEMVVFKKEIAALRKKLKVK